MAGRPTTLDAGLQARLETLAAQAVRDHGGGALSIAMVVADHQSGDILASIGSAGYSQGTRQGFVDMTRALRSPSTRRLSRLTRFANSWADRVSFFGLAIVFSSNS